MSVFYPFFKLKELKVKLAEIGTASGNTDGTTAGTEAGSKIDLPRILKEAIESAKKAATEAAELAKASGEEAQAKKIEETMVIIPN